MRIQMRSLGLELSRSTPSSRVAVDSLQDHMDGHLLVIQEIRAHTTALLEVTFASEEPWLTLIINAASTLESPSLEPMLRLCQDNGSSKLDHASESSKETTSGQPDTYSKDVLKSTTIPSHMSQSFSQTGMGQAVTQTFPPRP